MTAAEEMELLERWCPRLRYDSQAVFCAVSAAAMTDAQGNRVTRGKRIPASASGVPLLSLDWLRDYEHRGSTMRRSRKESIRQGADRLGDAQQFQSHPHYADRVHGRVVEDGGAPAYLQYWLYFYSAPPAVSGGWDQPGWRLVQIQLADARPVRVAVRNAAGRARQELNRAALSRPYGGNERLELFVSPLTNNLYFEPGEVVPGYSWDRANGDGRSVLPTVERFDGWESWPGQWGAPAGARSPACDPVWKEPQRAYRSSITRFLRLYRLLYGPRAPRRDPRPLAQPEIKARASPGRLVVLNAGKGRTNLLVTVHDGENVLASAIKRGLRASTEWAVELRGSPSRCVVRASTLGISTRRSEVVSHVVAIDEPDELERAIFKRVVADRLLRPEVTQFAGPLGVTEEDLGEAIDDAPDLWTRVAADMQAFRRARFDHWRADEARRTIRAARILMPVLALAVAASIAGWLAMLYFWGADITWALTAMGYYGLPVLAGIAFVIHWKRLRKARDTLEILAPAEAERESPLAGARRAFERAISEKAVAPILRERINKATTDRYEEPLWFGDEGLPELRVAEYEVPSDAKTQLKELTERMRGGSIGIAGPRGAGKTTLIETFCAPRNTTDRRLTTVLAAPVRYDARDFILTLFAQLCTAALAGTEVAPSARRATSVIRLRWLLAAGGVAIGAALVAASRTPADDSWKEASLLIGGVGTLAIGATLALRLHLTRLLAAVTLSLLCASAVWVALDLARTAWLLVLLVGVGVVFAIGAIQVAKRAISREQTVARAVGPDEELRQRAEAELEEIRYQQTFSSGYSGKLAIPLGGEVGVQSQNSLARRQAALPEVIANLRSFLRLAARARGEVLIGIDEMDKMESGEVAQQFLNEIKAIFGVERVYYLVSISEGAMSSFERRGLPFRDVFDSSFDEVISVEPLSLHQSQALLRARVVGLGPPYLDLCHCLSGGLARDLLRVARQLSLLNRHDKCLSDVCQELIRGELERKVEAAIVSAREIALEPYVSELLFWVRTVPRADEITVEALTEWSAVPPEAWSLTTGDRARGDGGVEALERIRQELAAYTYYLAAVLKLFTEVEGDAKTWFSEVETPGDDGVVPLDRLAQARIAFATNPNLARRIIGEFWDAQWPVSPAVSVRRIATPVHESEANGGAARAETLRELGFRALAGAWHTWRAPRA